MSATAVQRLHDVLERFEAKDVDGVVALFASDGVFADPHYPPPIGPAMADPDAIREALTWALGMLEQPGFAVRHDLTGDTSDRIAAAEVETSHRMVGGMVLAFTQVFVVEVDDDGMIRRMESYTPYPPPPPV
jgi:ketosteroid isomerase-like protein